MLILTEKGRCTMHLFGNKCNVVGVYGSQRCSFDILDKINCTVVLNCPGRDEGMKKEVLTSQSMLQQKYLLYVNVCTPFMQITSKRTLLSYVKIRIKMKLYANILSKWRLLLIIYFWGRSKTYADKN